MKPCCKTYLDEQFGGDEDVIGEIYREDILKLIDIYKEFLASKGLL